MVVQNGMEIPERFLKQEATEAKDESGSASADTLAKPTNVKWEEGGSWYSHQGEWWETGWSQWWSDRATGWQEYYRAAEHPKQGNGGSSLADTPVPWDETAENLFK